VIRRSWPWLSAAAALAIAACIDMSAPKSGVGSVSPLLLPSPGVVVGDVMRDSAGNPAPLSITVFDSHQQPISGFTPEFFVLDSSAHVTSAGMLFGDHVGTSLVFGSVAGIQTLPASVPVTLAPTTLKKVSTRDSLIVNLGGDTAQNLSSPLDAMVTGVGNVGVQAVVVRYRIVYSPSALPGQPPTAYIGDDGGRPSPTDTTVSGGNVSRRAVLRIRALGAPLPDSIVAEASASYKGAALVGSPVRFVVRVCVSFPCSP
jgi:hypothetical protein